MFNLACLKMWKLSNCDENITSWDRGNYILLFFVVEIIFVSRSDDQLELADISDSETSSILPGFARIQSRLNPVPESLNSPDIAPGQNKRNFPLRFLNICLGTWAAAKMLG